MYTVQAISKPISFDGTNSLSVDDHRKRLHFSSRFSNVSRVARRREVRLRSVFYNLGAVKNTRRTTNGRAGTTSIRLAVPANPTNFIALFLEKTM